MKIKGFMLSVVLLFIYGCAATQPKPDQYQWIQPSQAVQLTAAAAPSGVTGTFSLVVQNIGSQNGVIFLNSQSDYRDQRNLSVAVAPRAARQLLKEIGLPSIDALKGKHILVHGTARRVKVIFVADGKPTNKYYYQTHVRVIIAKQIVLGNEG